MLLPQRLDEGLLPLGEELKIAVAQELFSVSGVCVLTASLLLVPEVEYLDPNMLQKGLLFVAFFD